MADKINRPHHPDEPLKHNDHPRPVSRRDFLRQGFISGTGAVVAPSFLHLLAGSNPAHALSEDMEILKSAAECDIKAGAGKIPFICFDLAGGANLAGSNVLVGSQGGIEDSLSTAGYNKLGILGNELPFFSDVPANELFVDRTLGIPFHSTSSLLAGILNRFNPPDPNNSNVQGSIIPARSDNDTGNNPHNPMYGIARAGARGQLLTLIGSRNSVSGGNSMSPATMINLKDRPTKIDNPNDTLGLVDTGKLVQQMGLQNATRVMEAVQRITNAKTKNANVQTGLNAVDPNTGLTFDAGIKKQVECSYVKSADNVFKFGDPETLNSNPEVDANDPNDSGDPDIAQIFSPGDMAGDREFRKTAAVMKLVMNGLAGAGTITMGGYDYHTGERVTGDTRDFRAGECIGAILEYARLLARPVMIYICSDGSLSSNGNEDPVNGRLVWTGDNSSTAASLMLVYNPNGDSLKGATLADQKPFMQLGWYRPDASVETNRSTPMANNVNSLVQCVILNYMALHGEEGQFTDSDKFPNHSLGNATQRDSLTAFRQIPLPVYT